MALGQVWPDLTGILWPSHAVSIVRVLKQLGFMPLFETMLPLVASLKSINVWPAKTPLGLTGMAQRARYGLIRLAFFGRLMPSL